MTTIMDISSEEQNNILSEYPNGDDKISAPFESKKSEEPKESFRRGSTRKHDVLSDDIKDVPISDQQTNEGKETLSPQCTELPFLPVTDDQHEVVEIDLDNMGDNLDLAEIGRQCVEFGRASFNSSKKKEVSYKEVPADTKKGKEGDISEHVAISQENSVSDDVFLANHTDEEKVKHYGTVLSASGYKDSTSVEHDSVNDVQFSEDQLKLEGKLIAENEIGKELDNENSPFNILQHEYKDGDIRRKNTLESIPETEIEVLDISEEEYGDKVASHEGNKEEIIPEIKKFEENVSCSSSGVIQNRISTEMKRIEEDIEENSERKFSIMYVVNKEEDMKDIEFNDNEIIPSSAVCKLNDNHSPKLEPQVNDEQSPEPSVYYEYDEESFLGSSENVGMHSRGVHIQITDLDDDDGQNEINGLEIDFEDLDEDVKDAIESIDNLSSGVSDGGSIRTRSSTFKIGDDILFKRKANKGLECNQQATSSSAQFGHPNPHIYGKHGKEREISAQPSITLSYKDVLSVSSSLNDQGNPRRAIRSSITGVDLGTLKSISRNIDLSKGKRVRPSSGEFSTLGRSRSQLLSESSEDGGNVRIYPPSEKWRILKNLVFISLAFMILFTAFNTTQTYQSSINSKFALGSWSLAVYYFTLMISNMFLPVIITKWLGCKGSMVASCLLFAPYIVAQFYPKFYTLIPTSAAAGMGGGVLFCAQGTYASVMAETYMTVTGVDKEITMMLFFGIFFFLYLTSLLWGNLISAEVLLSGYTSTNYGISCNVTKFCGANFCPGTPTIMNNENLIRPPDDQLFIIWGILLVCVFAAAGVLILGVDSLCRYNETERAIKRGFSGCQLLAASIKHLGNPYQLLLIPVSALGSVSEAILEADFTYGYIACAWGIPYIGYVMICYGTLLLCFTLLLGCFAVRIIGRLPLMLVCFLLYLGVLAALKFWHPNAEETFFFFIVAGFWGIADASTVIITAMYGIVFPGNEEAAFSNLGISRALGYLLGYIMHPLLCMGTKMIIILVIILVAAAGYVVFEHLWKKASRQKELSALVPFKGWVDIPSKNQQRSGR